MTSGYLLEKIAEFADLAWVHTPVFNDPRGWLSERYSRAAFEDLGLPDLVQDNSSFTRSRGTVRGLHFQTPPHAQAKLFRVIRGRVLNIALDLREPHFGSVATHEMDEDSPWIFVPEGAAHGFQSLTADVEIIYKCSRPFSPGHLGQIAHDDAALSLRLPLDVPPETRSDRDSLNRPLADWRGVF
ncbi:dTDP-4-dehydrorhamnose 3,5-epimerase [Brevundimonas sp. NIBR10]|uniref:dTDP-4-dehydrorhamnose 3,5-epimerase family protein n=1 Tax=Brevundimonas sp. NIBR10 TaxID=3015997 RepID=UPI0022F159DA|nr:dTDP-4-dehydrorhamnose 3,5-epimerase [Brevundimonas sp. NIBR10]WGM46451.1 dTDP-4-dehydrorhamnose 3,5-epimerase [Brevundimonas sp. NIBR10]